jgi:hypothetical protein
MAVAVSIASASLWRDGVRASEVGDLGNRLHQPAIVGVSQFLDHHRQRRGVGPENRQACEVPAQNLFQVSSVAAIASRKRRRTDS